MGKKAARSGDGGHREPPWCPAVNLYVRCHEGSVPGGQHALFMNLGRVFPVFDTAAPEGRVRAAVLKMMRELYIGLDYRGPGDAMQAIAAHSSSGTYAPSGSAGSKRKWAPCW
ncbi:hypothetical protein SAMD00023353_1601370 [Rosellinia necatrix]|uniref:Uncharacterized protein n=1 Tax=Rosellinia necatrix TaxID=77044 RepID=A0A1S8A774_ROSNE|nr:hypothetical protein SAMD00023353_1601370 [Rosellinia necatrix]